MKFEAFEDETRGGCFGGNIFLSIFARKNSLKIGHQNFITFFILKFTVSKEICHLVRKLEKAVAV